MNIITIHLDRVFDGKTALHTRGAESIIQTIRFRASVGISVIVSVLCQLT